MPVTILQNTGRVLLQSDFAVKRKHSTDTPGHAAALAARPASSETEQVVGVIHRRMVEAHYAADQIVLKALELTVRSYASSRSTARSLLFLPPDEVIDEVPSLILRTCHASDERPDVRFVRTAEKMPSNRGTDSKRYRRI